MKFKIGDVIQRCEGGGKYRVQAIMEKPLRYKIVCIANSVIVDLLEVHENEWIITVPPNNETLYNVGQVLIKTTGEPRIALILKIVKLSDKSDFHLYEIQTFTPTGAPVMVCQLFQKELAKCWVTKDLKWVVLYGNPKKTVDHYLKSKIAELEEELEAQQMLLEHLEFFKSERYD